MANAETEAERASAGNPGHGEEGAFESGFGNSSVTRVSGCFWVASVRG